MVARNSPPAFLQRLAHASRAIKAVTEFLEQIAGLLRQAVQVVGWAVLLVGVIKLLISPYLTLEHLVAPSAGALAILQSLVRPWRRQKGEIMILQEVSSESSAGLSPAELDTEKETAVPPSRTAHL